MAVRVPEGYAGNLTDDQTTALAKLKDNLSAFIKEKGGTVSNDTSGYTASSAPVAKDPTAPIEPGTPEEEASEANKLLSSERDMLRFCRARQWDVAAATEMALNSVKWRASVKPWAITPEMIPNALPSGVWRWAGHSKSGMPVLHVDCENWKPSDYYGVDEYIRYIAYLLEGAVARMGEGVERIIIIYWIPGLNMEMMKPRASECAKVLMKTVQDQYPERLGAAFTCNAPALFAAMWRMVSPWIDPVTKAKFQIVPKGQAEEALLKYIDADVLPSALGGKHDAYPLPNKPIQEEITDFFKETKPPAASNVNAIIGCTEQTVLNGGMTGSYEGFITVRPGYSYSLQVHLEDNTKAISWSFNEKKGREFNFGYKVTEAQAAAVPKPSMFGGMGGGFGNPAAAMIAAKGASLLMQQEPEPQDFSTGAKSGKVEVQTNWAKGTLNLIFDNTAARFFSTNITYEVSVEAE